MFGWVKKCSDRLFGGLPLRLLVSGPIACTLEEYAEENEVLKEERDWFRQQVAELRQQVDAAKELEAKYMKLREAVDAVFWLPYGHSVAMRLPVLNREHQDTLRATLEEAQRERLNTVMIGPCRKTGPQSE